jgi:hypothetical protein
MKLSTRDMLPEVLKKLKLLRDLMHESDGVAGYHADGSVMPWDEWEDLSPESLDALIEEVDHIL